MNVEKAIGRKSSNVSVEPMSRRRMNPFTLRFVDGALERHYHDARVRFRFNAGRIGSLAGAVAWQTFTFLDLATIRDPSIALHYVRTIAVIVMLAIFGLHFVLKPGRWVEWAGFLTLLGNVVFLALVIVSMSPVSLPYFAPAATFTMAAVIGFTLAGVTFVEGVIIAAAAIAAFLLIETVKWPAPRLTLVYETTWMLTTTTFAGIGCYFLDKTQRVAWLRQVDLISAQDQIRTLLHNVLPPSIAARKLAGESPIADSFQQASLLFADVVGFTPLSSRFSSKQVVTMLNDLFERFDTVVARHGLEKIKTIGDCYMVAGGLPEPSPEHLERLMSAALEMQQEASRVTAPDGSPIQLRIGMHTGPVTAGVIGQAKFAFDVWGDTVNTASRMESQGSVNAISVSDEVRTALGDRFVFAGPEMVDVKGKGPTRIWTLVSGI